MFKKIINLTLIAFVLTIVILLIIDVIQTNPRFISSKMIKEGELEYNEPHFSVKYLKVIPLGEATLKNLGIEKYEKTDVYHLNAEANSLALLSSFFKAKAKADSFVDIKEQYPLAFLEHLEVSNKPDEDKKIIYDQKKNIMKIGNQQRQILPNSQDPLSAIFYIQQQKFYPGRTITIYLNTNQKNYDLNSKIINKQEVTIDGKKFNIWLLKADVKRHDKSPRHSMSLTIWFLENLEKNEKVPILIKAMTNVGPITAYLTSSK